MISSIVIPARDSADQLLYTLFSLNLQLVPFDQFEVIVVDNASADETPFQVAQFASNYPCRYVRMNKRVTLHRLLEEGLAQCSGEIVIFLSSNMMVPRNFVGVHQQAHQQDNRLVLLGLDTRRIYSVYDPRFTPRQHAECSAWLEQYPQIKRPYSPAKIIPLLEENQIASGLPFHIGLPSKQARQRLAARQRYGLKLGRHRMPWTFLRLHHVSFSRRALTLAGGFKPLPRQKMEQEIGKRLWKNGFRFQFADKLTVLWQERVLHDTPYGSPGKQHRRV
ncbi:glycosyltransferase family 2 protein [Brevibacillus sp. TJ4]|uniref:glycosyltransferase family 2 protein n=1 Tax=Brevibacillus sp. TJ4 TaxID=3234853 RepID=UPI003B9EAFDA